jgi:hypothetical protein
MDLFTETERATRLLLSLSQANAKDSEETAHTHLLQLKFHRIALRITSYRSINLALPILTPFSGHFASLVSISIG